MKYIKIEPEVIVGMGNDTVIDRSTTPPIVKNLHINLEDWLGDDLLENYPVFIVTERLKSALMKTAFSGYQIKDLSLTFDQYFENNYQLKKEMSTFFWLNITGKKGKDDFFVDDNQILNVSAELLSFLKKFSIKHAAFEENQVSKEVDKIFEMFEQKRKSELN